MKIIKYSWLIILSIMIFNSSAEAKAFRLSLFGSINSIFKQGHADDYIRGETDFPVIPDYISFGPGLRVSYHMNNRLGVELGINYSFPTKVSLTDPSDQDTVEINSNNHASVWFNALYFLSRNRSKPYLTAGGGAAIFMWDEEIYFTEYGYSLIREAPEKRITPLILTGAGYYFQISSRLALRFEGLYTIVFQPSNAKHMISFQVGATLAISKNSTE